jgi:hypothetical protein
MVQVAIPVRGAGFRKNNKKLVNISGNCIFHVDGEQTPQNRLLSFLAHRVILPMLLILQNLISIVQGVTVWRGSKNRMFP